MRPARGSSTWPISQLGDLGSLNGWGLTVTQVTCTLPVPKIATDGQAVSDADGGNGDGVADPGETIWLTLSLRNTGAAPATAVSATLTTVAPRVTLIDPMAVYASLPAGASAANTTPFMLRLGSVPCGTLLPFTLTVNTQQGVWHLPVTLAVGQLTRGVARRRRPSRQHP